MGFFFVQSYNNLLNIAYDLRYKFCLMGNNGLHSWMRLRCVLFSSEQHFCTSFHVVRNPYVGPDDRLFANGDASEDGGIGVDDDTVFEDGMARDVLDGVAVFVERKTLSSQRYTLVELDMSTDDAGGSDDNACAVVDGEVGADLCARVDVDARFAMCHFCDNARNERYSEAVELVGQAVAGEGFDGWVARDYFGTAMRCRVAHIGGFDIGSQEVA